MKRSIRRALVVVCLILAALAVVALVRGAGHVETWGWEDGSGGYWAHDGGSCAELTVSFGTTTLSFGHLWDAHAGLEIAAQAPPTHLTPPHRGFYHRRSRLAHDYLAGSGVRVFRAGERWRVWASAPTWVLAVLFALPPFMQLIAWLRRRRRSEAGKCPACGYDVRATPQRCPECGWTASPPALAAPTSPTG